STTSTGSPRPATAPEGRATAPQGRHTEGGCRTGRCGSPLPLCPGRTGGSAAELLQTLQRLVEQRLTALELPLQLLRLRVVALRPGLLDLPLQLVDRRLQLTGQTRGTRACLRVGPAPLGLLGLLQRPLHGLHPALDLRAGVPRHVADGLPALVDRAERGTGGLQIGDRKELLGLPGQLLLQLQVLRLLGVPLGEHRAAGGEEDVLRAAEAVPQVVLVLALGTAGRLPLRHQLAVARGRRTPLRGVRQRLGLRDQPLLGAAGLLALRVELREVLLAP